MGYIKRSWLGFDRVEEKTGISRRRLVNALLLRGYLTKTPLTDDGYAPACQFTITGKGASEGWLSYYWPPCPNDLQKYEAFIVLDIANWRCKAFLESLSQKRKAG